EPRRTPSPATGDRRRVAAGDGERDQGLAREGRARPAPRRLEADRVGGGLDALAARPKQRAGRRLGEGARREPAGPAVEVSALREGLDGKHEGLGAGAPLEQAFRVPEGVDRRRGAADKGYVGAAE